MATNKPERTAENENTSSHGQHTMVILQFNRLIRNKWVWGVFAGVICFLFCFDFLVPGGYSDEQSNQEFAGEPVDRALFNSLTEEARTALGGARGTPRYEDITNYVWRTIAVLKTAEQAGFTVGDAEIAATLSRGGISDKAAYQRFLAESGWGTPARFEQFLRHEALRAKYARLAGAGVSPSAAETERRIQDWSSNLAVFEVTFTNGFKNVKTDFAAYYAAHTNELVLPERRRVRYAFIKSDTPERLKAAAAQVDEDDIASYYQRNKDREFVASRTATQTVYKAVETVKTQIVERLTAEFARKKLKEDLDDEANQKLYGVPPEKGKPTWLDEVAKRENAKPAISKWIAPRDISGYTATYSEGAKDFPGAQYWRLRDLAMKLPADAAECDEYPSCAMIDGTNGVYILEAAWVADSALRTAEHLPAMAEAAKIADFTRMATNDACATAFRKQVEERVKTLAKDMAKIPADCTNEAAIAGARLAPLRRFSVVETLDQMEAEFQQTAARISQSNPMYAERNLQMLRNSMSSRLASCDAISKLPKGGLSEPEWIGDNSVRYTFMVDRERNGTLENDIARREKIAGRLQEQLSTSVVPGWFSTSVSRGMEKK